MSERPFTKDEIEANRRRRQQERREQQKRAGPNGTGAADSGGQAQDARGPRERSRDEAGAGAEAPASPRLVFQAFHEFISNYTPPSYWLDGVFQEKRLYAITAKTGHGKTAVAMCLAVHRALGKMLAGREVIRGKVIYFAAENPDDIQSRAILMKDRMMLPVDLQMLCVSGAFNLADAIGQIADKAKCIGGVDTIFLDTSVAFQVASGFDDENSNVQAFHHASLIRKLTGIAGNPCVIPLCHPTKGADSKDRLLPRGGGAFLNEIDGNAILFANEDQTITDLEWRGKFRGVSFEPISFVMERGTCSGLVDARGRMIPSVWAYPIAPDAADRANEKVRGDQDALMLVMLDYPKATQACWASQLGWMRSKSDDPDAPQAADRQKVNRLLQGLKAAGLAHEERSKWELTKRGRKEAEKVAEETQQQQQQTNEGSL
jgi:hypothetical protein